MLWEKNEVIAGRATVGASSLPGLCIGRRTHERLAPGR